MRFKLEIGRKVTFESSLEKAIEKYVDACFDSIIGSREKTLNPKAKIFKEDIKSKFLKKAQSQINIRNGLCITGASPTVRDIIRKSLIENISNDISSYNLNVCDSYMITSIR